MADGPTALHVTPGDGPVPGEVFVTPEGTFAEAAAAKLADILRDLGTAVPGFISVALAGGNTPRQIYEVLATLPGVPWDRLEIFFGDERAVPPGHADSNYRMAKESLLDRVPIPPQRVHRMRAEEANLAQAARAYAARLPASLDLLLLGVGTDGHTASLFPGAGTLHEGRLLVIRATSAAPPHPRLTVTPPVLRDARRIVALASGAAKSDAVARALTGRWDPARCPAQLARRGSWILDPAAAAGLPAHGAPVRRALPGGPV